MDLSSVYRDSRFPKPGILFQGYYPLLANRQHFTRRCLLQEHYPASSWTRSRQRRLAVFFSPRPLPSFSTNTHSAPQAGQLPYRTYSLK